MCVKSSLLPVVLGAVVTGLAASACGGPPTADPDASSPPATDGPAATGGQFVGDGPGFDAGLATRFAKRVDVFGIPVHATSGSPDEKVLHAANVLAEYLDSDNDGKPNDPRLVETLVANDGRLFMAVDRDELDEIFAELESTWPGALARTAWWLNPDGITPGDWSWQDLAAHESVPPGTEPPEFDGALEEVLHLITHTGLANAYPEAFAEAPGSRLGDALDTARGGQFLGVPDEYPEGAAFTYDDETCIYQCQATEFFYWALTSLLGGQDYPGRLDEIGEEWRLNSADKLREGNPGMHALLTDPDLALPTVLPDGFYQGFEIRVDSGGGS